MTETHKEARHQHHVSGAEAAGNQHPASAATHSESGGLPGNAPADVRARAILNRYPELFKALARA